MNFKFTLLNFLLLFTLAAGAQSITGIWRGHFVQNTFGGYYEDRYKFEVQIDQAANNALKGVTYSYKTTVFYGKATLQGIYTEKTNNIILNETALVELKMDGESQACLMTCYLEYSKMGNLETLTGTYTSRQVKGKGDCGSGKVYLERTTETDFYKEDFLLKKEAEKKKPESLTKKPVTKSGNPVIKKKPGTPLNKSSNSLAKNKPGNKVQGPVINKRPPVVTRPPVTTGTAKIPAKPRIKPGAEDAVTITKRPPANSAIPPAKEEVMKQLDETPIAKEDKPRIPEKIISPKPEILKRRGNELVKTIYTSAHEIKVQLYDNGEIDGDTISVYHNNELIVSKRMLSDKPITFTVKADEFDARHEFVMVAENLGTIPPNTASMVITAGSKRYDLFISSTEQKNAMVLIEYKPEN